IGGKLLQIHIGKGHAQTFGLTARIPAGELRIAIDACRRLAEHLVAVLGLGVGVVAAAVELAATEKALPAGNRERHDDAIADIDAAAIDVGAEFFDDAHGLVAHDVAGGHERDVAVIEMQIRAADAGGSDADNGVAAVDDFWIGDIFYRYFIRCTPG